MKVLIERLRDSREVYAGLMCCTEAADLIEAQAAEIERLETKVDRLEWENKGIAEWRSEAFVFMSQRDKYEAICDKMAEAIEQFHEVGVSTPATMAALTEWRKVK